MIWHQQNAFYVLLTSIHGDSKGFIAPSSVLPPGQPIAYCVHCITTLVLTNKCAFLPQQSKHSNPLYCATNLCLQHDRLFILSDFYEDYDKFFQYTGLWEVQVSILSSIYNCNENIIVFSLQSLSLSEQLHVPINLRIIFYHMSLMIFKYLISASPPVNLPVRSVQQLTPGPSKTQHTLNLLVKKQIHVSKRYFYHFSRNVFQ